MFKDARYRISKVIGIIGFGDTAMCEMISPPLATIYVPIQAMEKRTVQRLISIPTDQNTNMLEAKLITFLVKRGSM